MFQKAYESKALEEIAEGCFHVECILPVRTQEQMLGSDGYSKSTSSGRREITSATKRKDRRRIKEEYHTIRETEVLFQRPSLDKI